MAALLHTSAVAFSVLKYLGVAYLLYLAWSSLREKGTLAVDEEDAPASARKTIVTAVLINLLNPKLTIFFFAFLPQFVAPGDPSGLLHGRAQPRLHGDDVRAIRSLRAARLRGEQVISRPRVLAWMRRAFAGSFVALGAKLALTRNS